jgi:CubicO group peptidase (beta-lactamase class C family)
LAGETRLGRGKGTGMEVEDMADGLDELVCSEMSKRHVPGVALAVVRGDEEWTRCYGITNVNHPLPVTPTTLFQVGSITKTMTALLILQFVAEQVLDLDAPLKRFMSFTLARGDWADRLTTRHLLTHTTGWAGDHFLMQPVGERGDAALARLVELLPTVPLQAPPGEIFAYSNAGFAVLGRLAEVLGGMPFDRLLSRKLLAPLGMAHTFLLPDDVITERVASGHRVLGDAPVLARPWALERAAMAHGGVISDVRDLTVYVRFHLGNGRAAGGAHIVPQALLEEMRRVQVRAGSICDAMGLSWQLDEVDGCLLASHGGETNGQVAYLTLVPERGFGFVVLTNADTGRALTRKIAAWLLRELVGVTAALPPTQDISQRHRLEYAGRYTGVLEDVELEIAGDALVCYVLPHTRPGREPPVPPPPVGVKATGVDMIITVADPEDVRRGEFIRGGHGDIRWLRWDGRLHARMQ